MPTARRLSRDSAHDEEQLNTITALICKCTVLTMQIPHYAQAGPVRQRILD